MNLRFAIAALAAVIFLSPATSVAADNPYVWQNVTIVAGGFVPGIIFSPREPGLIYARTDIGGAYRWDNQAKHWVPLNDWASAAEANLMGCESIAPDPVDANKVYIAAGMYSRAAAAILRSSDRGRTFQISHVPFTMGGNENGRGVGERLDIDPADTNVLYFASRHDGLWKSTDGAATWKKVSGFPAQPANVAGGAGLSFVVFDPRGGMPGAPTASIYVGVANPGPAALYHSGDGGKSWQRVAGQPGRLLAQHGQIDAGGMLYISYGNGPGPNGVSDGSVWKLQTATGKWTNITPLAPQDDAMGFGYGGLSIDARHPGTLAVATLNRWHPGDDVFRSTDGGATWHSMAEHSTRDASLSPYLFWGNSEPSLGWWIAALAIDPFDSNHVLYGTGATIWGTDDFTQLDKNALTHWSVAAAGLEETAVLDLISPPVGPHLISALGDIGGFRHDDLNVSPAAGMLSGPIFNNTYSMDFAQNNPAIVIRAGSPHEGSMANAACSIDGGESWTPLVLPRGTGGRFGRGASVAVSADGAIFLSTRGTSSISKDRGKTWTACRGLPRGARPLPDRADAARFYALDAANGRMYASSDGGASFAAIHSRGIPATDNSGGFGAFFAAPRLAAVPGRAGDLWLYAPAGLQHSTDGGLNFASVSGPTAVTAIGFGKAAPGADYPAVYIAGTVAGKQALFRSDDQGARWVRINDDEHQYGYPPGVITGDPRVYGRLYIGTNGRGILYGQPVGAEN